MVDTGGGVSILEVRLQMSDQRSNKPIAERIKDKIRGLLDELVEAIDGLLQPQPQPVPVRSRRR